MLMCGMQLVMRALERSPGVNEPPGGSIQIDAADVHFVIGGAPAADMQGMGDKREAARLLAAEAAVGAVFVDKACGLLLAAPAADNEVAGVWVVAEPPQVGGYLFQEGMIW